MTGCLKYNSGKKVLELCIFWYVCLYITQIACGGLCPAPILSDVFFCEVMMLHIQQNIHVMACENCRREIMIKNIALWPMVFS